MTEYAMTTIGPPPDWWGGVFEAQQLELRAGLRRMVRSSTANRCHGSWLRATFHSSCHDPREIDHALEQLVADGVFTLRGGFYSIPEGDPS